MIDAKNWIIDDKDKILADQEDKIWHLTQRNSKLTDDLAESRRKYAELEKLRKEIDIAAE